MERLIEPDEDSIRIYVLYFGSFQKIMIYSSNVPRQK
ncbi:CRISPR-associated endonuclease Cas2 [Anabaena sp. FACHB-1237]|nr:CRISPR-associated endonuclease Cas2 [Anabaena sp. FACHB-1237]